MRMNFHSGVTRKALLVLLVLVGSVALLSSTTPPFGPGEKAFYADEATLNFVRAGLVFKVESVDIAADGTVKARFTMKDKAGAPLDRLGIETPATVSSSFIIAHIPKGQRQYVSYTTRRQTSPITGQSAVQASADTPNVAANYQKVADGTYIYTFSTKLPAGFDRTETHSVGVYGSRNLSEFELGTSYADNVLDFVPDGSPVVTVRDVIATKTCEKCHDALAFHGGSRRTMPLCNLCHSPQTIDPDTGNTVDMPVMIHKIHMGKELPSVIGGKPYTIIGNAQSVHDYSEIGFPADTRNCAFCHEAGTKQADAWLTNPNRAACGACHDNVNFATGEGHLNLPQPTDGQCKNCHTPEGELEFDASIKGAHMIPRNSSYLSGVVIKITSLENTKAGERPVVNFTLTDKWGAPLTIASLNRVAFTLGGPTTDYVAFGKGYVTETATASNTTTTAGGYRYTFTQAIPADAKGSFVVEAESRRVEKILAGTQKEQDVQTGAPNQVVAFSVDGSAVVQRRQIVSLDKCNACHANLILHGENRNKIEACVVCHNPVESDTSRRPAAQNPPESVDFNAMIHRIHAGTSQTRDYTVYGFGNTPHNYNKIGFPGALANCTNCHLDNTMNVPANATAKVVDPRGLLNPVGSATAACTSCHTSVDAASHALANTTSLGESCGACHGANSAFAVSKVHAQ